MLCKYLGTRLGLGLVEAKKLADQCPFVLARNLPLETAKRQAEELRGIAVCELVPASKN